MCETGTIRLWSEDTAPEALHSGTVRKDFPHVSHAAHALSG